MTYEEDGIIRDEPLSSGTTQTYKDMILNARNYFNDAYMRCNMRMKRNIKTPTYVVESALENLQMEAGIFLRYALQKKPHEFERLNKMIDEAKTMKDYKKILFVLDEYFYKFGILTNEQDIISGFTIGYNKMYMKKKGTETNPGTDLIQEEENE